MGSCETALNVEKKQQQIKWQGTLEGGLLLPESLIASQKKKKKDKARQAEEPPDPLSEARKLAKSLKEKSRHVKNPPSP